MRTWQLVLWAAVALTLSASASTQSKLAEFRIKVIPTATGVQLECESGCAWTHLSWGCEQDKAPCQSMIDQNGVVDPR